MICWKAAFVSLELATMPIELLLLAVLEFGMFKLSLI